MRPIFFELYMSLVIIIDGLVHQESTEKPGKGLLIYATAAQKSIRYRRMCPTDGPMARGARGDIPGNNLGQGSTSTST